MKQVTTAGVRRYVLYSHDTMGLGHMRRNLYLARLLSTLPHPGICLLITGAREGGLFHLPAGVDCLTLPALHKEPNGAYRARSLGISLTDLVSVRARTICAAIDSFEPDVLIVDNVPRGARGELDLALKRLSRQRDTRCVLGLRDVLDDPDAVQRDWFTAASLDAIREHFTAIWVYGDPRVFDPVLEYRFPSDVAAKVRFTGYLDRRVAANGADGVTTWWPMSAPRSPICRMMLCLVGGGQDGERLASAFAAATLPGDAYGVIVTGPFMPREVVRRLQNLAASNPRLQLIQFTSEPTGLLEHADRIVSMGGSNTVSEILSYEKPALIVPRISPRREQLIRAQRLCALGLVDMLHPDDLNPDALTHWLGTTIAGWPRVRDCISFRGLACLPHLVEELFASPAPVVPALTRRDHLAVR
jgi:predicted glycosyltransferase